MRLRTVLLGTLGASALLFVISPTGVWARSAQTATTSSVTGYDVAWPQCPATSLPGGGSFGIVDINGGKPWSQNSCAATEYAWASKPPRVAAFYENTANPGTASSGHWGVPNAPLYCDLSGSNPSLDDNCAYDYGWNSSAKAFEYANALTSDAVSSTWWLDVESGNSWNSNQENNAQDIQGAVDYLRSIGVANVGIYSNSGRGGAWDQIVGLSYDKARFSFGSLWNWIPGARNVKGASQVCANGANYSFTGGPVKLAQYPNGGYDGDLQCF